MRTPNTQLASTMSSRSFNDLLLWPNHRGVNREPCPDRLMFQITRTTISPNYSGEELETLNREVLVVSADVPPQDGETDEQRVERESTNAARATCWQQELTAAAPPTGQ
jgi:hypothetical protein